MSVKENVTPEELLARITSKKPPVVVDVRSRAEFDGGHVPGAVHIPFWKARSARVSIPATKDDPIVVYCKHGPRAWMAGAALKRRGFKHISYLTGHMHAWRKAGLREET